MALNTISSKVHIMRYAFMQMAFYVWQPKYLFLIATLSTFIVPFLDSFVWTRSSNPQWVLVFSPWWNMGRTLWGEHLLRGEHLQVNTFSGKNTLRRTLFSGRTLWGEHFLRGEHFEENSFFEENTLSRTLFQRKQMYVLKGWGFYFCSPSPKRWKRNPSIPGVFPRNRCS